MKALVLAGGYDQIELIKELKKRDYIVYLVDYYENPPAKSAADKHFIVSTLDIESVFEIAKKENVDLVTTACTDQALLTVAIISERLELPCYISAEIARKVTDKVFMKHIFKKENIPSAKYYELNGLDFVDSFDFSQLSFPVIVKPCDCNSSKGVTKVFDETECRRALIQAFEFSRSSKAIIEEYNIGEEVSIDCWKDSDGVKIVGLSQTNKIQENKEIFTIFQSVYPIDLSGEAMHRICNIADKLYSAFNINQGPLLIQAIVNNNDVKVIEIGARMGGGTKYRLIEYMTEIKMMQTYVNFVLGDTNQILTPKWSDSYIEMDYVYAKNGLIRRISGVNTLLDKKIANEIFIYKSIGEKIEQHSTSGDRVLGILVADKNHEQCINRRKEVIKALDILDENNKSIMLKEIWEV